MNVVDFAWDILDMSRTIREQELEITRLLKIEEKYNRLLDNSLRQSNGMHKNTLKIFTTPGVLDAYIAAKTF